MPRNPRNVEIREFGPRTMPRYSLDSSLHPREQIIWIFLILVGSILPASNFGGGQILAYIPLLGVYLVLFFRMIGMGLSSVTGDRKAIIALIVVTIIYLIHSILAVIQGVPDFRSSAKGIAFVIFAVVNIFYLPRALEVEYVLYVVSRLTVGLGILGIVGIFITLGFDPVSIRSLSIYPFGAIRFRVLSSLFSNLGAFGRFTMIGVIAGLVEFDRRRDAYSICLLVFIFLFLLSSSSRSSIIATLLGSGLYAFIRWDMPKTALFYIVSSIGAVIFTMIALVGLTIMGIEPIVTFSKRNLAWYAAFEVILDSPILGIGPKDTTAYIERYISSAPYFNRPRDIPAYTAHNSFMRVFIETGLVGGLFFAYFVYRSFKVYFANMNQFSLIHSAAIISVGFMIILQMQFSSFSIFGLRASSVLGALSIGYLNKFRLKN